MNAFTLAKPVVNNKSDCVNYSRFKYLSSTIFLTHMIPIGLILIIKNINEDIDAKNKTDKEQFKT